MTRKFTLNRRKTGGTFAAPHIERSTQFYRIINRADGVTGENLAKLSRQERRAVRRKGLVTARQERKLLREHRLRRVKQWLK